MMKRTLIVGGANGIGLAIAKELTQKESCEKVYIVDKAPLAEEYQEENLETMKDITENLFTQDISSIINHSKKEESYQKKKKFTILDV